MDGVSAQPIQAKPFIKWAGGKGQLLEEIRKHYPQELGKSLRKYAEPFLGGGAVLLDILSKYQLDEVYISDANAELVNVYTTLRDNCSELIAWLQRYEDEYLPCTTEERKNIYYQRRARFNELQRAGMHNTESSALFIFLNKTCFNGLYRVNAKGEYNVPMGDYKRPTICDSHNLTQVSQLLNGVTIRCADYSQSESFIDAHTFAYFDPPYRPLSSSSNFTAYTENIFGDQQQIELGQFVKRLVATGARVLVSNSDPKNVDANDNFFDDLYSGR